MSRILPFRGLRPRPDRATQVVAPPYDVLSEQEARDIVARKPRSFLTVTRPEVNLPGGVDSHSAEAYAAARIALETHQAEGNLEQDETACFYLYAQKMGEHRQTALMALCSTEEYDAGAIKKHEYTRPDKEQDRVDHMLALEAQTGLVFLAYRQNEGVREALSSATSEPLFTVTTDDGVEHSLSRISDPGSIAQLTAAFANVGALYIADGHHRSAAASRVAAKRQGADRFLCGIFPDDSLYCMAYNRLVKDLAGFSPEGLLTAIREKGFTVEPTGSALPPARGTMTLYLRGQWHLMTPADVAQDDPVGCLDVQVLQDRVLAPLLGIEDPRRDTRIAFVGGIRGPQYLQAEVDARRAAVAFHMYATGLDQLFAVADADRVMPPKSTWFEPKLAGGMLINLL